MKRKYVPIFVGLSLLITFASNVQAEIYKWMDKNGTVRYTDTPPPNGSKPLSTFKHNTPKPVSPAPTKSTLPADAMTNPVQTSNGSAQTGGSSEELEKKKREIEEIEKKNKAEKEAQAKQKQLNCAAAKANFQSYDQGGRIYKNDEKGERVYLGDKELADGAAQAKKEISQYCN
ncbi:MAG: hypothetical protein B7X95_09175 [Methylophilaceae bacterium 17-44-8]|nr:MAG: hypothetical protein B7Y48_09145 [Methylophilales bacterium 28-44-11]OZA04722.1 MAG: hypothetical protein B7X95_09175 [Methylophilaceae bacterium 17-44-8]